MGHALGTDACLVWYPAPQHFLLVGVRQEGGGHRRVQSGMAIPVPGRLVTVGRGRAISCPEAACQSWELGFLSRLPCSCHLKSMPALGTPSLFLTSCYP